MRVNLNPIIPNRNSEHAQISRLLLIAAPSALFEGLARAIDDRLPLVRAEVHEKLPEAAGRDYSVRVVLLHHDGSRNTVDLAEVCAKRFPNAAIALLVADMCADCTLRERMFQEALVQGVVPLTLKLDVWLAAVSMLLNGGEYYPPARLPKVPRQTQNQIANSVVYSDAPVVQPSGLFAADRQAAETHSPKPQVVGIGEPASGALPQSCVSQSQTAPSEGELPRSTPASRMLEGLTGRERQILELVSEGHQNKLIAHRISLSEHTVKVHVHNLLTKLRVTNRTQAAAAFRSGLMWIDAAGNRRGQGFPSQTEAV